MADLYRLVSRFSGVPIPAHFPIVGSNAFRHCAGVHSQAVLRDPRHYQSLDPFAFGLQPDFSLDHMSGRAVLQHALESIAVGNLDRDLVSAVLRQVKAVGKKGRTVGSEELGWIVEWERAQAQRQPVLLTQSA